jgi:hypothetical protein
MADALIFGPLSDKELQTKIEELSVPLAAAKIARARRCMGKTTAAKPSGLDRKLAGALGITNEQAGLLKAILSEAEKLQATS